MQIRNKGAGLYNITAAEQTSSILLYIFKSLNVVVHIILRNEIPPN